METSIITNDKIREQKKRVVCPVELSLRILGGKWRGSIMYQLRRGPLGFNEIKYRVQDAVVYDSLEDDHYLSAKVLSEHLSALQDYGLLEKIMTNGHSESHSHKYQLSEKGQSAIPLLLDLFAWGESFY